MSISQEVFHNFIAERFPFEAQKFFLSDAISLHPNIMLASPNYFQLF